MLSSFKFTNVTTKRMHEERPKFQSVWKLGHSWGKNEPGTIWLTQEQGGNQMPSTGILGRSMEKIAAALFRNKGAQHAEVCNELEV